MVILLNGCINSGKTTIGKEIASMNIGFAHIEVDHLRHFIEWMPLADSIELNLRNAAAIAINFHKRDIDSIITYPLSDADFEFIGGLLDEESIPFCAVSLFPGLHILKNNRGDRELTVWELNRIDELHRDGLTKPTFGKMIDNSNQKIRQTALDVLQTAGIDDPQKEPIAGT